MARNNEQRAARAAGFTPDASAGFKGVRRSTPLLNDAEWDKPEAFLKA
jgi:hypothetical protein